MKNLLKIRILLGLTLLYIAVLANAQRREILLTDNWRFSHSDNPGQEKEDYKDSKWQLVKVPHDWAISGPFDKEIDKQTVAIEQNGETEATEKTGRSGSLPWIGVGWYRTKFTVEKDCERAILNFDGAMSEPKVYVNGKLAGEWKYGYTPFNIDITPYIYKDGRENTLAVRLENVEESSRWYPGAGLYRPVKLITTKSKAILEWGINVITESISAGQDQASVTFQVSCTRKTEGMKVRFVTLNQDKVVTMKNTYTSLTCYLNDITTWSPENPQLYDLTVQLLDSDKVVDEKTVKYGIRTIAVQELGGFILNGTPRKIKGVCLHHDLGMLGAAVNKAALRHQLMLLKSMGCDAIRTSHNMPSQWQMELCDSLGLMVMAESFDMWVYPKCKNGYSRFYKDWWQRDLENLVCSNLLHPSIVMWSIGNEIPEQGMKEGNPMTRMMQDFIHEIDRTRPVTAGMDRIDNALATGYAQILDVPGMNYRTQKYQMAYEKLRHGFVLGSETASTVSSRGVYKFPVVPANNKAWSDGQCNGYDVEACWWSNLPEADWCLQDDKPWVIGEFVWTGFDYLGEPTPYDEYWPSRSSYFGIFDLAGLPKDRYWLYRSHWNQDEETIHLLPHWTWPGREGEVTPVYCYTNYPTAELFVNGKSQGKISKRPTTQTAVTAENQELLDRYRLRWNNVVYEPGEIKVVVYDSEGVKRGEKVVKTAGRPDHVELTCNPFGNPEYLTADGEDMMFVTARIVDKDGNLCPDADNLLNVKVSGAASFKGICNGDATSLEVFTRPSMHVFKGELMIGVISNGKQGDALVTVTSNGLKPATLVIKAK